MSAAARNNRQPLTKDELAATPSSIKLKCDAMLPSTSDASLELQVSWKKGQSSRTDEFVSLVSKVAVTRKPIAPDAQAYEKEAHDIFARSNNNILRENWASSTHSTKGPMSKAQTIVYPFLSSCADMLVTSASIAVRWKR